MHCKSYSHFFSKKFQRICVSLDVNFNESLTNDVVSFEQLGPGYKWCKRYAAFQQFYCCSHSWANILANIKKWNSRQNRRKWYDWPGEILKKKWGLMNACEILMNRRQSLRISYEPYDLLTINLPNFLRILSGCYGFLRMPLQILRMLAHALWMKHYTTCACQCFLFVKYSPAFIEWTSNLKMSSCYPSSCPGVEERAIVAEAGARERLTTPSWIQRLCFRWRSIQWWPDQAGCGLE